MNELIVRNKLKSWAKEVMNNLNIMGNDDYIKHKAFIIRIFGTILLIKATNIEIKVYSKEDIESNYVWSKLQKLYDKNNFKKLTLNDINDDFYINTINFLVNFCEENCSYLDNILAWLYQYLNINAIDNKNKDTQFFTDQYMVEYLVRKSIKELGIKKIISNDCIDPACGGGNFIVAIIEEVANNSKLNSEGIINYIKNHIFGYDIDKNLSIICIINMYIKLFELDIISLEELFEYDFNIYYDENNKFGALLKNNSANEHMISRVTDNKEVKYLEIFTNRYLLVITNPPFKGRREQEQEIRDYITDNYKCSKGDICNSFVERIYDLLNDFGIASFVMQNGCIYLESYKELREKLLNNGSILSLIDLGSDSFYDLSGEKANILLLVYSNKRITDKFSVYSFKQYKYIEKISRVKKIENYSEDRYELETSEILKDKECRIEYLSIGKIKDALKILEPYSLYAKPMQGTSTGDSKKFVKYHWEVDNDKEWCLVSKGGGYCKWTGLNIFKVKWGKDGEEIKQHPKSVVRNVQYFDKTDLVYSDTGTSGLSVRLLRKDQIFIASGPGIYIKEGDKYCHLAFLNSRLASYYIKVLTPKLTISATYIGKIPVVREMFYDNKLSDLAKETVQLKLIYNKKRPINYEYTSDNFIKYKSIYVYAKEDFIDDLKIELKRLKLEKEINDRVIDYYNFTDEEIKYIYSKVGLIPYDINKVNKFDINELDIIIEKILDNNCYVKSFRANKQTLGVEGILEFLAVNNGISVEKAYSVITGNVDKFRKTILKYYKHTLHRIKLSQIGYLNDDKEKFAYSTIDTIIMKDKKVYDIQINEKLWFEKELYAWHSKAFLNKPILTNGDNYE